MNDGGIHCLVFSKDRAMQLDAFLRSARHYVPYASITVQLGTSVGKDGYRELFDEHSDVGITTDMLDGFEPAFRRWLETHKRVVFHTDDDIFFATPPPWVPPVISYRLGRNTIYCHPRSAEQALPKPTFNNSEDTFTWEWKKAQGDFGYPLTLNGTVYRSQDLLPLLDFEFANPTELEAGLAARADRFGPQWMTAPLHSCCVSLPHNRVSVSSGCPAGSNPDWQPDALRERFLAGWRIDLDAMDFSDVRGAHQEIPLKFRRLHTRP